MPVVDISRDSHVAGGAANVAVNIASLGAHARVAGFIGNDEAGRLLKKIVRARGVDPLATPGRGSTILKTRVMVQKQQLCRLDRESAPINYVIEPDKIESILGEAVAMADAVILSDYAKGVITEDLINQVQRLASSTGKLTALDPKPKRALKFKDIDLITPNKREAAQLAGIELDTHSPYPADEICAEIYRRHRPRFLVVTLGEGGMLLSQKGKVLKTIPTAAREVFDVSGAGDTALASLLLALTTGASLEDAAHFANAAAGVVVGKLGTATVTPAELLAFINHQL